MKATLHHLFADLQASELLPIFSDVESYPRFVPGFKKARIVQRNAESYRTRILMALELGPFTYEEELLSVTREFPFTRIEVHSTGSRFIKTFDNTWHFRDDDRGCDVTFEMTLEFAKLPTLVQPMLGSIVDQQAKGLLRSFVRRVEQRRRAAATGAFGD